MFEVSLQFVLFVGSALFATVAITVCIAVKAITTPHPVVERSASECSFLSDSDTGEQQPFPSIDEPPTLTLSVVVPAFDEQQRLPAMLDEALGYLHARAMRDDDFTYELIVVSDGSRDETVKVAQSYANRFGAECVRVLALERNRGKGGAVRLGVQSCRGRLVLFADADGATQFADVQKLLQALPGDADAEALAIGSRAHLEQASISERSLFRTVLMHGFHALVWLFAVRGGIRDTQCGFKLFTRPAARRLFALMHVERWAFDVELLYLAQFHGMRVSEVAVRWTEIDGSKVTPVWSWLQMGRDLFLIWFRYTIGAWSLDVEKKTQ